LFNLVSASAATGVSRSTVLRAIKAGKISAERDATGGWSIQPCELFRVFPPLPVPATEDTQQKTEQADGLVDQLRNQISDLRNTVEDMRRAQEDLRRGQDDLRQDRDAWREAFQNTQRLLEPPRQQDDQLRNKGLLRWWWWRKSA
jgi:FtsZ-binding cell division protein ZapB